MRLRNLGILTVPAFLLAGCGGGGASSGGKGSSPIDVNQSPIIDLGAGFNPNQINGMGQIAGAIRTTGLAVLRSSTGVNTNLPAIDGTTVSFALALNNQGVVGGLSQISGPGAEAAATVWSNGKAIELPLTNNPNLDEGSVSAINNNNQIVGNSLGVPISNPSEALYWASPTAKPVALTPLYLNPTQINDSGLMVGFTLEGSVAEYYKINVNTQTSATDLHLGGDGFICVNNSGTIVCDINEESFDVIEISPSGTQKQIASGYVVEGINSQGDVIMSDETGKSGGISIYTPSKGVVNLSTMLPANSGWTLSTAVGINDDGQVIGYGTHNGNTTEGFLMQLPSGSF